MTRVTTGQLNTTKMSGTGLCKNYNY